MRRVVRGGTCEVSHEEEEEERRFLDNTEIPYRDKISSGEETHRRRRRGQNNSLSRSAAQAKHGGDKNLINASTQLQHSMRRHRSRATLRLCPVISQRLCTRFYNSAAGPFAVLTALIRSQLRLAGPT
jgi:hypothetical protein